MIELISEMENAGEVIQSIPRERPVERWGGKMKGFKIFRKILLSLIGSYVVPMVEWPVKTFSPQKSGI